VGRKEVRRNVPTDLVGLWTSVGEHTFEAVVKINCYKETMGVE
jgi:hypothetical protein